MSGDGNYTQLQAAEVSGISLGEARRMWRAVGFAEVGDDRPTFTSADVAVMADIAGLITTSIVGIDGAVELARPYGHLLSRLAAARTSSVSEVVSERLNEMHSTGDPVLPGKLTAEAVAIRSPLSRNTNRAVND